MHRMNMRPYAHMRACAHLHAPYEHASNPACLLACLPACLPVCLVCLPACLSACLLDAACLSICRSVRPSVCLSLCLVWSGLGWSVCPSVCLSVRLFAFEQSIPFRINLKSCCLLCGCDCCAASPFNVVPKALFSTCRLLRPTLKGARQR